MVPGEMPLTPPIALVTGAAARIGRALAIDLSVAGWTVAVHYNRSADDAAQTVRSITQGGGSAASFGADLSDEDQAMGLVDRATRELGPITCLINNASVFDHDSIETVSRASWERHISVNLRAPLLLSQHFSAALPKDADGTIINLIDQRVWNLTPHFVSYTVSKSGLWTLTRTLALALAPRIRVNAIGPGPTLPSRRQSDRQFSRQVERTPLGRANSMDEICAAVRFILDASSMTGQMIALDSGQHLGWQHLRDAHLSVE